MNVFDGDRELLGEMLASGGMVVTARVSPGLVLWSDVGDAVSRWALVRGLEEVERKRDGLG